MNELLKQIRKANNYFVLLTERFRELLLRRQIEKFYLIIGGHIFFQTLSASVQFDLFNLLDSKKQLTRKQISKELQIQEQPARILLLGLTSLGLVKKKRGYYSNTLLSKLMLTKSSSKDTSSIVKWQHFINYNPMYHFHTALREGKNVGIELFDGTPGKDFLYGCLSKKPELEKIFQDAMQEISVRANQTFVRFVDLSEVNYLLDIGGGNGTNIIEMAKAYPHLRAAVFDSNSVVKIAQRNIKEHALENRLSAISGDCFKDHFPQEVDAILFCHFFTIWSEERNCSLLQKCFESLPNGGRVMIFNMAQWDNENGPLTAAMGSPYFLTLATGEGMLYTVREYKAWMHKAGFAEVTTQRLPFDHVVITGVKH